MIIKISSMDRPSNIIRQTPGSKGIWGNFRFVINSPETEDCDWWVVLEGVPDIERANVPKRNTILITGEPPCIKQYQNGFLNQFSTIITCHSGLRHPHVMNTQQGLAWWVGLSTEGMKVVGYSKTYDDLKAMDITSFRKEKLMSIIASNANLTEGHRKRMAFAEEMKSHFGDRIDVFGRGPMEIEDKWKAIAPYRYHIALENSSVKHYWSEKISDAYLGGAYPLYYGCPNLDEYFPKGSFTKIDIADVQGSIDTIERAIESGIYEKSLSDIAKSRDLVLDKYNLFPMLTEICGGNSREHRRSRIVIRPEAGFGRLRMWAGRQIGRG